MQKKLLYLFFFLWGSVSIAQTCPRINNPVDGAIDVPVDVTITWPQVNGIVGYLISLGTTPGGTDILNRRSAGLTNAFTPAVGLPDDTQIYVTISIFFTDRPLLICPGESFRTIDVTTPPGCTRLVDSADRDGIAAGLIAWEYAPTATGYRLSIGSTPGATDIADNLDVGNVLTYRPVQELNVDEPVFVTITPYNENGDSPPCSEESYTIGAPVVECGGFFPKIDLPDRLGICANNLPTEITTETPASGFRWYVIHADGSETLLSENREAPITKLGRYRLEAYNNVSQFGVTTECAESKEFLVVRSEAATVESVSIERGAQGQQITLTTTGDGDYEFALDSESGTYQDIPVFENVPLGEHTIFVRDKNGCGVVKRVVGQEISARNFPRFFTPNGDGVNDYWQFVPLPETKDINVEVIYIFNSFGSLVEQIDPKSVGWDGNYQGKPLPSSDYWFKAISFNSREIRGHFTLKR